MKVIILGRKKKKTSPSLELMQELWTSVPVVCDGSFEMKVAILEEKKTFKLSSELMQELWTSVPVVYDRSVVVKVAIQGIISPSSKLMQEL